MVSSKKMLVDRASLELHQARHLGLRFNQVEIALGRPKPLSLSFVTGSFDPSELPVPELNSGATFNGLN